MGSTKKLFENGYGVDMSNVENQKLPTGSVVAIVTPMHKDGSIHWDDFASLIEWHISSGTQGIVVAGTTGECATFSIDEQAKLFQQAKKIINNRVSMIAGTGSNCTSEAIDLSLAALEAGADATLSVVPYYNKPSQEGMYQHFLAQADAVNIPQILYNVPSRTGCDLSNETVLRLAAHDNIAGLKDATGDLERGFRLMNDLQNLNLQKPFLLYSGDDMSSLAFMKLGGHGSISVTANVKPAELSRMFQLAAQGQWDEAYDIDSKLRFWHKNLFIESSPAPSKYALAQMKKIETAELRLPLVHLSQTSAQVIDSGL